MNTHENRSEWLQTRPGERCSSRIPAADTNGAYSVVEIVSDPCDGTPIHIHQNEHEHFVILEGTARILPSFSRMTSENPISGTLWPEASFFLKASLPEIRDLMPFWRTFPAKTWPSALRIASSDRFAIVSAAFWGDSLSGHKTCFRTINHKPHLKSQRI